MVQAADDSAVKQAEFDDPIPSEKTPVNYVREVRQSQVFDMPDLDETGSQ